ncbi:restriction endonuclease [Formosa sp. A9]|uniref:restriction endonuclease n=1 Tax=Formosa sp. A9 TaxID=3442641 RepID=UPI003EC0C8D3
MNHTTADIKFEEISPKSFENLCYDLLIRYNYSNLIWREGGADNGRDIEGIKVFSNQIKPIETKWFFECKHYTSGGVPPDDLTSKIAWADAELPDFLVVFISSYLTNNARTWIDKISVQKPYEIIVIEGEELKNRIVKFSDLVETYFSIDRYLLLFKEIQNYKTKFNIKPSFEFLKEIIENINFERLTFDEIGFLAINFYEQYELFESRNDYYGDFDKTIIYRLLEYLKNNLANTELKTFEEYQADFSDLGGRGIFDEIYWLEEGDTEDMKEYDFQYYDLHLNPSQEQSKWKIGHYLFVRFQDVAFEFFESDEMEIRKIEEFNSDRMDELVIGFSSDRIEWYKKYLEYFSA